MVDHTDTTISGTSISYSMEEINTAKKNLSNAPKWQKLDFS